MVGSLRRRKWRLRSRWRGIRLLASSYSLLAKTRRVAFRRPVLICWSWPEEKMGTSRAVPGFLSSDFQTAGFGARNDRGMWSNITVVSPLQEPTLASARRLPSPVDFYLSCFYLSWMSPDFVLGGSVRCRYYYGVRRAMDPSAIDPGRHAYDDLQLLLPKRVHPTAPIPGD